MDSLKDLPVDNKSTLSPEHKTILDKYVGAAPNDNGSSFSVSSTSKWKTTLYIALVFLSLVNPITQGLLSKIPHVGDNYVSILGLTTLIFVLGVGAVMYFL